MTFSRPALHRLLLLVCSMMLLGAGEAQARRRGGGFRLYTFGPANSEIGPIKPGTIEKLSNEARQTSEALRVDTVGFNYQHFGLFWFDIWSWSGKFTVYNKLQDAAPPLVVTDAEAAALLGIPLSELSKPLSYHIPWGLVIILGLVSLKVVPRLVMARRRKKQQQSVPDFTPPPPSREPHWTPPPRPAGGPPPIPPPLPPEQ